MSELTKSNIPRRSLLSPTMPQQPSSGGSDTATPVKAQTFRSSYPLSSSPSTSSSSSASLFSPVKPGCSRNEKTDSLVSVYVAIRLRPALSPSEPGYDVVPAHMRTSAIEDISATSLSIKNAQTRKKFNFDQVFDQDTTQQQLWDHISSSLTSFIQGYNVSIMAYGQSGSGKSYTMGTNGESMGIISRAAELMFPQLKSNSENNSTSYIIRVSYLEIYNEQIRDLLIKPSHSQGHGPNHVHATPITIRENSKGEIVFTGLSQIRVDSVSDLLHLLNLGCRSRQTSSTVINAESSRSHAIFTVYLTKQDHQFDEVHNDWFVASETVSKLNFVDLAGSERLKTTGAVGDKAKEGISINSGLANLGKVISQLSDKSAPSSVTSINSSPSVAHISYRDSKLTRVLQDSLGKRAITYLISCITCEQFYYSETLNTLTYAQRARAIQSTPEITKIESSAFLTQAIKKLEMEVVYWKKRATQVNNRSQTDEDTESDCDSIYSAILPSSSQSTSDINDEFNTLAHSSRRKNSQTMTGQDHIDRSVSIQEAVLKMNTQYEETIQSLQGLLAQSRADHQESLNEKNEDIQLLTERIFRLQLELETFSSSRIGSLTSSTVDDSSIVIKRVEYDSLKRQVTALRNELRTITAELHQMRATNVHLNQEIERLQQKLNSPPDKGEGNRTRKTGSQITIESPCEQVSTKGYGILGMKPIMIASFNTSTTRSNEIEQCDNEVDHESETGPGIMRGGAQRHRRGHSRTSSGGYRSLSLHNLNLSVVSDSTRPEEQKRICSDSCRGYSGSTLFEAKAIKDQRNGSDANTPTIIGFPLTADSGVRGEKPVKANNEDKDRAFLGQARVI